MRALALAVALALSGCLTDCAAIGGGSIAGGTIGGLPSAGACSLAETPVLHYAARLETGYSDSDPVSSLTDNGSYGYDVTQGTGVNQPTYVANDSILGAPVIELDDGTNDTYLAGTGTHTALTGPFLWCALVKADTVTTNMAWFGISSGSLFNTYIYANAANARAAAHTANASVSGVYDTTAWHVHCGSYDGTDTVTSYFDGSTATHTGVGPPTPNTTGATIGVRGDLGQPSDGRLAEAIAFSNTSLTGDDILEYWACIYGVSLPAS